MAQRRPPRLWVILNLDHFRFDQTYGGTMPPDRIGYAPRDHGNRVGAWRIKEVLDKHVVRALFFLHHQESLNMLRARFREVVSAQIPSLDYTLVDIRQGKRLEIELTAKS